VALGATIYQFEITLSDVDRGVYETLSLRVARHPSESIEYLVTRVLAYCLEHQEGIAFTKGVGDPDEPAILVRDLTGAIAAWIEIGSPDADRLHKAAKASPRVAVYTIRDPQVLLRQLEGKKIHKGESIPVYGFDKPFFDALVSRVDRRTVLDLSVTERHLYLTIGGQSLEGRVVEHRLG
jgi:uncharacterized protein YaeQ